MSQVLQSEAEVLSLSPDAASTKAAQGLVKPSKWPNLGQDDDAVWGECQGSGSNPYQTQVDLSSTSFKCSCPSRKFPCKHGLALLLLRSQGHVPSTNKPTWVEEWLLGRKHRADKKEASQALKVAKAADPEAQAKRESKRWPLAQAGLQDLSIWLYDSMDLGLARLSNNPSWQQLTATMAARMVDAKIPAIGNRLERLIQIIDSHQAWPQDVLNDMSLLQLVLDAALRWDDLDEGLKAHVVQILGWSMDKAEVMVLGVPIEDEWTVVAVGQFVGNDGRSQERHVWLQGRQTKRMAFILDFAYVGRTFEQVFACGQHFEGKLYFYQGPLALRVVLGQDCQLSHDALLNLDESELVNDQQQPTQLLAHNPWQHILPMWIHQGSLQTWDQNWYLVFEDGSGTKRCAPLQLSDHDAWVLLAQMTQGPRYHWFGEWNHSHFRLLSMWQQCENSPALQWSWSLPKELNP